MIINFSAPSKTFLVGEYAVLNGGPALVLCTNPRFQFSAQPGNGELKGIAEKSPAGMWLMQHKTLWSEWNLTFEDPHQSAGGFGASGAQFLFAHNFVTLLKASVKRAAEGMDLKSVLSDYKAVSGGAGSGVDIVAQATGLVARVVEGAGDALPWPYPELDFAIVRTGEKVATHEHLSHLNLESLKILGAPTVRTVESFGTKSSTDFVSDLRSFASHLRALKLQVSQPLLERFEREPWCIASKGCGAMGADTVLVFFAPADWQVVKDYFLNQKLVLVATSHDLNTGLEFKWSHS